MFWGYFMIFSRSPELRFLVTDFHASKMARKYHRFFNCWKNDVASLHDETTQQFDKKRHYNAGKSFVLVILCIFWKSDFKSPTKSDKSNNCLGRHPFYTLVHIVQSTHPSQLRSCLPWHIRVIMCVKSPMAVKIVKFKSPTSSMKAIICSCCIRLLRCSLTFNRLMTHNSVDAFGDKHVSTGAEEVRWRSKLFALKVRQSPICGACSHSTSTWMMSNKIMYHNYLITFRTHA